MAVTGHGGYGGMTRDETPTNGPLGRGALNRKAGLALATSRLSLVASLILLAVGSYEILANKQDANLVASLFMLTGTAISLLQLFIKFPILPIANDSLPRSETLPFDGFLSRRDEYLPPTSNEAAAQIPVVYGLAFSLPQHSLASATSGFSRAELFRICKPLTITRSPL
jgi:hypothetical protein